MGGLGYRSGRCDRGWVAHPRLVQMEHNWPAAPTTELVPEPCPHRTLTATRLLALHAHTPKFNKRARHRI